MSGLLADDTTMKVGLLMESAQVHQKLAEGQLEKLRAHTADLDAVVRDEIRRTLVDELQMLTAETTRATRALQKLRSGAAWRGMVLSLAGAMLCSGIPIALARWALPSPADIATLRARREELALAHADADPLRELFLGQPQRLAQRLHPPGQRVEREGGHRAL